MSALAIVLSLFVALSGPANAVDLASHRAGYNVTLGEARDSRGIAGVSGVATMTVERSCDGYVTNQHLTMRLESSEGAAITQDLQYSSWELATGGQYRFTADNRVNGKRENFTGSAKTMDDTGMALFSAPDDRHYALPGDTLFPTGLTATLIERAEAADFLFSGHLFDGSDGSGPNDITAFITPRQTANDHGFAQLDALTNRPGWVMRVAFYPFQGNSPEPEYEVEVLQLDNGVQPRLVLDYQGFSVILTLKKIEALPTPDC